MMLFGQSNFPQWKIIRTEWNKLVMLESQYMYSMFYRDIMAIIQRLGDVTHKNYSTE